MMKWQKFLAWGVLGGVMIGLSACAATPKKAATPVKITYWHRMTGSWNQAQQHLIDGFNHSQSKYQVVAQSQGSYDALQQKLMAAAKSKTLPTMAQAPYTNIADDVHNQLLAPISVSAKDQQAYYPSFLQAGRFDDKQYGLPYAVSTQVLYVNTDLVKQHHLSVPKTWAEVAAMGPKLKAAGLATIALDKSYDVLLESMAAQADSPLITADGKANFTGAKDQALIKQLLAWQKAGIITTAGSDNYFSTAFFNRKAVFGIASSASIPVLQSQAPKDLHWTTAAVPGGGAVLTGNYNVVFKSASKAQQAGATAFMHYLQQADHTAYWAQKSGYVPVSQAGVNSARYQQFLAKNTPFKAASAASKTSFASPVFVGYGEYRNALLTTVDDTLTKGIDGKTAFDALQKKTAAILAAD